MAQLQSAMPPREYLWDIFQKVDKDRSGLISADELRVVLSNGTWTPFNPETVRLMIGMFEDNHKGQISFEGFSALWKYIIDWQACFRSFDRDNSGNIDRAELGMALKTFGYNLSPQTIESIFRKFDRLGKNTILFDDFIQCSIMLNNLTGAFRQYDTDQDGVVTIQYDQFLNMMFGFK